MKTARLNQRQADSMKKGKQRNHNLVSKSLIIFGLLLIVLVVGIKLYSDYMRKLLLKRYDENSIQTITIEKMTEPTPTPSGILQWPSDELSILPDPNQPTIEEAVVEDSTSKTVVIGKLLIPKLNLEVAISEGVSSRMLRYSAGHFTGTALPGQIGNCAITGHRSYLWGEFFNRLDEVVNGDEIILSRDGERYTYIVTDKFVVEPEELWVLNQGIKNELTLITCTPIRVATHRLIVKAELVN